MKRNRRIHYGWVIVFACMLLSAASTGLVTYFSALFVTPVSETFGISRAAFLLQGTFLTVTVMVMMPFTGRIFQTFSMKKLLLTGTLLSAGAFWAFSYAQSIRIFYLGAIFAGIGSCLFGAIPMALLVANWFNEKRGLATGISFCGSGIISVILSPVISDVIANQGWRPAYQILGTLILVLMLPTIFLLIKVTPEEIGERPYGAAVKTEDRQLHGYTKQEAMKQPAFWILALAILLLGIVINPTQQQLVAYWSDMGNDAALVSKMYSLAVFVGIFAKILLGGLFDRLGGVKASAFCGVIGAVTYGTLIVCTKGAQVAIPAALFGGVIAVQVVTLPYLSNSFFGDKDYGSIYGLATLVFYLGVSIGIPFSAFAFDAIGTYQPIWAIFAAAMLLFAVLVAVANYFIKAKEKKS